MRPVVEIAQRFRSRGWLSEPVRSAVTTLVSIRVAFWVGTALTLLWAPLAAEKLPPFRAYDARTDLLFGAFAQYDAQWFLHIVEDGYDSMQATAFFPGYPLAVEAASVVFRSPLVAGVLVSLAAAAIGAAVVVEIGRRALSERVARDGILLLALFPTAFVFTAPQSDSLFLALSGAALLSAYRDRPLLAGLCGGLAVGTRLLGLALLPALAVILWRERTLRGVMRLAPLLMLPAAAALYALYLERTVGDAFAFAHAYETYWVREVPTLGPIGGLWQGLSAGLHGAAELLLHLPRGGPDSPGFPERDQVAAWNIVHACLLVAALALTWVAWRRLGAALGLYSAATLALVLASQPEYFPLASFPRYLVGDFPLFLALASLLEERPRVRQVVIVSFAAVGALAAVAYSRAVWVA